MIIKIKSNKKPTFRSLLKYMFNNRDRLKDSSNNSFTLIHNLKDGGIENWHKQLIQNEHFRKVKRSNSVYFTHEILSWHRDDSKHLTLDKMEDMTKEYIAKRNPKGMYIATAHFDKGHYHVHILASGIEYRIGKSLRMSRTELSDLKKGMQEYQLSKYPELLKSIIKQVNKGKVKHNDNEYQMKLRTRRASHKDVFMSQLRIALKKSTSIESFQNLLHEHGMRVYTRRSEVVGIIYANQKFRFNRLGINQHEIKSIIDMKNLDMNLVGIRKDRTKNNQKSI